MFNTALNPSLAGDYYESDNAVLLKDLTTDQRCTSSRQAVMLVGEYTLIEYNHFITPRLKDESYKNDEYFIWPLGPN